MLLVRSYRTFAPLPGINSKFNVQNFEFLILNFELIPGGIFLWHYPHDRSHWALPSKSGSSGVRTFLRLVNQLPDLQPATTSLTLPRVPV